MYLDDQAHNADNDQTELKQLRISQHGHPLLSQRGQEVPSGMERPTAYRILAALKAVLSCLQHSTRNGKTQQKTAPGAGTLGTAIEGERF